MRDLIFRRDWTTSPGVQLRLDIMLPHSDALSATPTVVAIPDDCILKLGKLTIGYDKLPIGQPEFKSLQMTFNLGALSGNTDLELLRDCLLYPQYGSAGLIGPIGGGGVPNVFIGTYTWCRLYYHDGVGYEVIFEGAIRPLTTSKMKVRNATTADASTIVEIQWTHMVQVVMETLRMEMICERMLENVTPGGGYHKVVYDVIYKRPSDSKTWVLGEGMYGDNVPQAAFYTFASLIAEVQQLLQQIYRKMVRSATATFATSTDVTGTSGTPIDHITLYRQVHDGTSDRGGSDPLPRFIGRVWPANQAMDMDNDLAGLLVGTPEGGSNQNSFFRFASVWDWHKVLTEGMLCKTEFRYTATGIVVWWAKIWDSSAHAVIAIPTSSILGREIEIERGSRTLSSVKVAVPGMEGDDTADYESSRSGVENEEDRPMRLMWHTLPKMGAILDRLVRGDRWTIPAQYGGDLPGVTGNPTGLFTLTMSFWTLWYLNRPQSGVTYLTDADVYIRYHNDVEINVGTSTGGSKLITHNSTLDWDLDVFPYWPDPCRGTLVASQRRDGMPQLIADTALQIFGQSKMALYKIRVLLGTIIPEQVGDLFKIGSGSANDFITPDTYLTSLNTTGHLVQCELDLDTGIITAELLHIPELT